MEFEMFSAVRDHFCKKYSGVTEGRMMGSPAIHYKGKVFAFFSRKKKMVFKLGEEFPQQNTIEELREFNPFKNKGPLKGWFELGYDHHHQWEKLTDKALQNLKQM